MKITTLNSPRNCRWTGLISICFLFLIFVSISFGQDGGSRRTNFNENWRFQKNDPSGADSVLAWDKVKDWVAATGNEYVIDGAKAARPAGNLGESVVYTTASFNDSSWRSLNLPHDWAIEGDFQQELPGETGKRPWTGVGWYRKHFTVEAKDKGKQIYIDFTERCRTRRFGSTANSLAAGLTDTRRSVST